MTQTLDFPKYISNKLRSKTENVCGGRTDSAQVTAGDSYL